MLQKTSEAMVLENKKLFNHEKVLERVLIKHHIWLELKYPMKVTMGNAYSFTNWELPFIHSRMKRASKLFNRVSDEYFSMSYGSTDDLLVTQKFNLRNYTTLRYIEKEYDSNSLYKTKYPPRTTVLQFKDDTFLVIPEYAMFYYLVSPFYDPEWYKTGLVLDELEWSLHYTLEVQDHNTLEKNDIRRILHI